MAENNVTKEAGPVATVILPIILALISAFVAVVVAFKEPIAAMFFGTATPAPTSAVSPIEASLTPAPTLIQPTAFTTTISSTFAPVITAVNFHKDGDLPNRILDQVAAAGCDGGGHLPGTDKYGASGQQG